MPVVLPLIAAVAAAATTAGVGAALTAAGFAAFGLSVATSAAIVGGIAGAVVAFGVSAVGSALFPVKRGRVGDAVGEAFSRTQQFRQPITAHRVILGRARVSGPIVFLHTNAEARTGYTSLVNGSVSADYAAESLLYLCHAIAGHEISLVEAVLVDNDPLTDEKFRGRVYVEAGAGASTQAASPLLLAETDGKWTAAHRLRGRAYLATVLKYDPAVFQSGIPNISAIVRGALVYDPRAGATGWSNNAAILVAHYIAADFGLRADWSEIDIPTLVASANICDERVPLAAGGDEARYTINGAFDLDEAPGSVLERLVAAMAGAAVFVGGKWYIHAGAWQAPTLRITEDMLRGAVTVRANRPARDLFNGVRSVYVRPAAGWQPTDAPPVIDAAALAQDAGVERYADLALNFTASGYRAQRIQQIVLRRNRMQRQVSVPLNLSGLQIRVMDTVELELPRLPLDTYRVVNWRLSPEGGVDLLLEQDAASVYEWDADTDEQALGDVASVDFPAGATLDAPVVTVTTPTTPVPATIAIAWGAISGAGSYSPEWRQPNTAAWTAVTPTGTGVTVTTAGPAAFRVQARNGEAYSLWCDVALPPPPDGFQVSGSASGYDVIVTLAAGTTKLQIFEGTTDVLASATKRAEEPVDGTTNITDGSGILKYVWARSVNAAGNVGTMRGPLSVDPGVVGDLGGWGDSGGGDSGGGDSDGGGGAGDGSGGDGSGGGGDGE